MKLYLSSSESPGFSTPCEILQYRKKIIAGRHILVVKVNRPLIGQEYGYGGTDISEFYLANRVNENAFDKLDHFPIDVHVLIPKIPGTDVESADELRNIAWACLYDNLQDAINHRVI